MSDQSVAREVRSEVEAKGGSRLFGVRAVRDAFGRSALTRKARSEIADALAAVGVFADPSFDEVRLNEPVRLYVAEPSHARPNEAAAPRVGAGWFADPDDARLVRYWDGNVWTEHRRPAARAGPVWTPSPPAPNLWQRFRGWPAWAQWTAVVAALILAIAAIAGDEESGDGGSGSSDLPPAQQAAGDGSADEDQQQAREREEARERAEARDRKRDRARRKRERARQLARERRRERRREEARERRRREREARQAPPEEPAPDESDACDSNYSGCVPVYPPDVDCPDVDGPVTVIGGDPHRLDADNDGEGCES